MMYQIGETVWAIINMFDIPKKVKIKGIEYGDNASSIVTIKYRVQYKMKEFIIMNEDIYPTQIDAEIYWAICIQQYYRHTLEIPDLYITDDFIRANNKAKRLIHEYAEKSPDKLLKYL